MNGLYKNKNLLHIITDLAGRFIKIKSNEIDREIKNTLKTIGEITEVDACHVYIYSDDLKFFEGEYKWNKDGINIEDLTGKSTTPYKWSIEKLKKLDPVTVNYPFQMSDTTEGENKFWEKISLKSSLVIPFSYERKLKGCIACRSIKREKNWSEEDVELLKLLVEIIAGVLERKKIEEDRDKYKNNLEDMVEKEKEERLKTEIILSGSSNAINDLISVIDRDMKIVMSNWKGYEYIPQSVRDSKPYCYNIFRKCHISCKDCHIRNIFETEKVMEKEYIKVIDGKRMEIRLFPVFEGNRISMIVQTMRDITEKRRMEEESSLLRRAIENTKDCIIIREIDGTIHYVNSAFEAITGYKREEILGKKTDSSVLCVKEDTNLSEIVMNTIKKGQQKNGRTKLCHREGHIYDIEFSASPLTDSNGDITGYISIFHDITEKIKIENQLRQSQKMEAIGTLAGGIAHDFNNILGAIIINAEIAFEDIPANSHTSKNIEQILSASNRATDLVKQILTFSRYHEEELKPVQVSLIVKEALKLLRASIPSTIEIKQDIMAKASKVLSDPTQIHQIIMNLCTNAYHAMRDRGGIIKITLEDIDIGPDDLPVHDGMTARTYVRLSVSDTGCGIEDSIKERIFEPYFTTKKSGEGTGMGLSVIHGIAKNYGGIIKLYSEAGKGSSFHVYLPKIMAETAKMTKPSRELPKGTEYILLVDDEEAIVLGLNEMLRKLGYKVSGSTSSKEALKIFRRDPEKFDLLITDQTMPEMTGSNLAKEIMTIRPDMPVILCTGFSEIISHDEAKDAGIKEFIMKPVRINNMAVIIRNILDKKESNKHSVIANQYQT